MKSSPSVWHLLHIVKSTAKFLSNFVAFFEDINFMTFLSLILCNSYIPVSTVTSYIILNDKEYFVTVFGRWWLSLVSFVGMRGLFIPTYHVQKSLLDGNPSLALDLIAHQSYTNRGSALYLTWQYSTELFCYIYDPRARDIHIECSKQFKLNS